MEALWAAFLRYERSAAVTQICKTFWRPFIKPRSPISPAKSEFEAAVCADEPAYVALITTPRPLHNSLWKTSRHRISKGKVRSVQELAKEENTTVETITRNLPLAALNPNQIEKLLIGHHAPDLSVAKLLANPSLI